jgi:GDPmannose 4,6-dehydratase
MTVSTSEMKSAFITGITGQDGSYLTELLLEKGYVVHGLVRRSSNTVRLRLDHLTGDANVYGQRLFLHYADLDDVTTVRRLLQKIQPNELYHLAGQSHVGASFDIPESTCEFTAMGTLRLLEILRDMNPQPKFLHASSSEVFGRPTSKPQTELTPFCPVTPYGVAKAFATNMVRVYRDSHSFFCCNAICYNHESPRRGESFVTRKITKAAAAIAEHKQDKVRLGNIDAQRDWGYAPEYVEAMWRILQQPTPGDFIVATGKQHSVRDFLEACFQHKGLRWQDHVEFDPKFMRPSEVENLVGDPSKAKDMLGWEAQTSVAQIAKLMVDSER